MRWGFRSRTGQSCQGLGSARGQGRGWPGSRIPSCSRPPCFPFVAARRPGPRPRAKSAGAGSKAAEEVPRGRDPQPVGPTWRHPAPGHLLCLCPRCCQPLGSVNKASRLPSDRCALAHAWGPGGAVAILQLGGPQDPGHSS